MIECEATGMLVEHDRYQNQPRHVKAYRWLRHKPVWWLTGLYWAATIGRMEPYEVKFWGSRWAFTKWVVRLADYQAERQMKRYWGLWELFENPNLMEIVHKMPRSRI